MATQVLVQPRIVQRSPSHPRQFFGGPEMPLVADAASQAYGVGDFLYLNSAGAVAIATVDGSDLMNGQIAGLATDAATGVTGRNVHFETLTKDCVLEMNVYHGTVGSAISALAQLGVIYAIKKVSSKWHVDIESTAESATVKLGKVKVIGFTDPVGDTYGKVKVVVVEQSEETDGGSHINNYQLD